MAMLMANAIQAKEVDIADMMYVHCTAVSGFPDVYIWTLCVGDSPS